MSMPSVARRPLLLGASAALTGLAAGPAVAAGRDRIIVAMTLADLPSATGAPDQGTEGFRFMGLTLYDALVSWDLSRADIPSGLRPGLATGWHVDPADPKRWVFTLRQGVRFHDGSVFDSGAVVWNLDKILNPRTPQYDISQVAQTAWRIPSVASYRALGDDSVEVITKVPDATLPYQLSWILMPSPARWAETKSWTGFARSPSGTGPWTLERYIPRQQAVLRRFDLYWDPARVPRSAQLVLLPIPDPSTRTAALLSKQVDWIESPSPDAVEQIKSQAMTLLTGPMPHIWPYKLNVTPASPCADLRVRQALNLAIDRDGIVDLLSGLAIPAKGVLRPDSPWFGRPTFDVRYDPAEARRLLADAGYGPKKPLKLKFAIANSGAGQMYPLPMNEFVQQNFRDVGVELDFEVLEWQAFRARRDAGGAKGLANKGLDAINHAHSTMDPFSALIWHVDSRLAPPAGLNWGFIDDPDLDRLCDAARGAFDPQVQNVILGQIHQRMVDQALWIFGVHDVNPRVLAPGVKGVVQAQSWFVDFSPVTLG